MPSKLMKKEPVKKEAPKKREPAQEKKTPRKDKLDTVAVKSSRLVDVTAENFALVRELYVMSNKIAGVILGQKVPPLEDEVMPLKSITGTLDSSNILAEQTIKILIDTREYLESHLNGVKL